MLTPAFGRGVATRTIWLGAVAVIAVAIVRAGGIVTRRYFAGMSWARVCATLRTRVVDRYRAGVTIADALTGAGDDRDSSGCAIHGAIETAVLELLDDAPRPGRSAAGAPPVPARRRQAA